MTKIAIFDYGAGNIFSLKNALEKQDATVEVQTKVENLKEYDGIFLPGVGNFDPAIQSINRNSADFLEVVGNTPVFGICLGMEMFFEKSQEGIEKGLGIINGDVIVLPSTLKVPHMGWNSLEIKQENKILEGIEDGSWAYFVHSYRANPTTHDVIVAESDYDVKVPAIVQQENYFGTQFHPEKSGNVGALMLENFLRECSK
ncbi:MAG: imidazole glycerol phosphate synthase subunit HisH [Nitrosopumilus sp. (ex Thoosa mismalolli)]|nr:imidazole glycerol phosphate synthase subunit HisH [Nitrosopumilus sp. (ex Thoosa mismalolli)]